MELRTIKILFIFLLAIGLVFCSKENTETVPDQQNLTSVESQYTYSTRITVLDEKQLNSAEIIIGADNQTDIDHFIDTYQIQIRPDNEELENTTFENIVGENQQSNDASPQGGIIIDIVSVSLEAGAKGFTISLGVNKIGLKNVTVTSTITYKGPVDFPYVEVEHTSYLQESFEYNFGFNKRWWTFFSWDDQETMEFGESDYSCYSSENPFYKCGVKVEASVHTVYLYNVSFASYCG